ncbi:MAG: hypothetical protein KHY80_04820 [Eggerthella sp.]|nr:hypothetical protein [Eggerthella sp.]
MNFFASFFRLETTEQTQASAKPHQKGNLFSILAKIELPGIPNRKNDAATPLFLFNYQAPDQNGPGAWNDAHM